MTFLPFLKEERGEERLEERILLIVPTVPPSYRGEREERCDERQCGSG